VPELPEVDALALNLRRDVVGRVIERVDVASIAALKTFDPPVETLHGAKVDDVRRIGKHLDLVLTGADGTVWHVVIHLARAGWLKLRESPDGAPPKGTAASLSRGPVALRITFTDGATVAITDAAKQKKVAVSLVADPQEVPSVARLGIDPLVPGFDAAALGALLDGQPRKQIKGLLRDQSTIAGIGNAYSDEILHAAGISPFAPAGSLDPEVRTRLHDTIVDVLTTALAAAHELSYADLKDGKRQSMNVHGRTGAACPVCGDVVREVSFSDSSLQYCATCQTGGKPLKDRSTSKFLK
jgi:formamidopyrimidine-DNA glycosylase